MQTEMQPGLMVIDVRTVLTSLLIIAAIALVIYGIYAVYHLVKTLKQSQKVLGEFEVVSHIASERTQQLDKLIDDTAGKIKSGQNILNAIPLIITAVSRVAKVVGQYNDRKGEGSKK